MSFWFLRKNKDGRRHYLSISVPLFPVVALLGLIVALLMPLLARCR